MRAFMENDCFNKIFVEKTHSIKLIIDNTDSNNGSRIGGFGPKFFDNSSIEKYELKNYLYYFTVGNDILDNIKNGNEISTFYPKDFLEYNRNYKYPDFPIKCIIHEPSERGNNEIVYNKEIKQNKIISKGLAEDKEEVEDVDNMGGKIFQRKYGIKVGGNPALLQNEEYYYENLLKDNYQFILQMDESEYLRDQINGNEPFNHGIVYFYGKIKDKNIEEIIGGYWQN
jgi:hypothetical protein